MAIFLVVFGLIIWFVTRGRSRPPGLTLLLGLPGLYLAALPAFGGPTWLLAPGLVLLIGSYLVQLPGRS
jgi:hypothetical protein